MAKQVSQVPLKRGTVPGVCDDGSATCPAGREHTRPLWPNVNTAKPRSRREAEVPRQMSSHAGK